MAIKNQKKSFDKIVWRTRERTFRRCQKCGLIYIAFSMDSRVKYEADYFGSEYKAQYGRSYLEDFDSIKAQGIRRGKIALSLLGKKALDKNERPRLLDIGCAYGPFLSAAKDLGFEPYGSDISKSALDYAAGTLGFKCALASFADIDSKKAFGFERFDAVSMWYVIEHCRDLSALLTRANGLLREGGIFCFSTPSAGGASGRLNKKTFFESSPRDHYTLWEPKRAKKILRKFGFKLVRLVPTGIHPERIAFLKKIADKPFFFRLLSLLFKLFVLGDTFEVYCKKIGETK